MVWQSYETPSSQDLRDKNKSFKVKALSHEFSVTCSRMQSLTQPEASLVHWVNPMGGKPRWLVVILASCQRMKPIQGKPCWDMSQGLVTIWAPCWALPEGRFSQWICHYGPFGLNQPELDFSNIKESGLINGWSDKVWGATGQCLSWGKLLWHHQEPLQPPFQLPSLQGQCQGHLRDAPCGRQQMCKCKHERRGAGVSSTLRFLFWSRKLQFNYVKKNL